MHNVGCAILFFIQTSGNSTYFYLEYKTTKSEKTSSTNLTTIYIHKNVYIHKACKKQRKHAYSSKWEMHICSETKRHLHLHLPTFRTSITHARIHSSLSWNNLLFADRVINKMTNFCQTNRTTPTYLCNQKKCIYTFSQNLWVYVRTRVHSDTPRLGYSQIFAINISHGTLLSVWSILFYLNFYHQMHSTNLPEEKNLLDLPPHVSTHFNCSKIIKYLSIQCERNGQI